MSQIEQTIQIKANGAAKQIEIDYAPQTERTLYDICDVNGRILKTGAITSQSTHVDITGLGSEDYIVLILDGDRVHSRKFRV